MATAQDAEAPFDAIVIGTGFAGAVTACRLVEAGFRICVLERGRRYGRDDFPKYPARDLFVQEDQETEIYAPPPDFSRFLWNRDRGLFDVRDLGDTLSVQAAGYGGGSLIYANVHLRPPREVFERGWPAEYTPNSGGPWSLDPYFDLAAYMLRVSPIPQRLAKTAQLKRAGEYLGGLPKVNPKIAPNNSANHWFRTPLAVNFDATGARNDFGREQNACDMRGRCCVGCDNQSKNTLDLNYLARAEDGHPKPDIRTLAEVVKIRRSHPSKPFTVTYNDLLFRSDGTSRKSGTRHRRHVRAHHVFLCAGAVSTTELLLKNPCLWDKASRRKADTERPLGSHYFPNADSLAVVFDCDQPQEIDYGPTITSALLYQEKAKGEFSRSLDFDRGRLLGEKVPVAGVTVRGAETGATAVLTHAPILDWGDWESGNGAVGALVLGDHTDAALADRPAAAFKLGERLEIGGVATAVARSTVVEHKLWFVMEDGGYPPDLEPLVGVFRSPLWVRRNRYLEPSSERPAKPTAPPRRAPAPHLRVQTFKDAVGGTATRAIASDGLVSKAFGQSPSLDSVFLHGHALDPNRPRLRSDLLREEVKHLLPSWFVAALANDREDLVEQAAAFALPMLGSLLDELSKNVARQLDPDMLARLGVGLGGTDVRKEVLIRGMIRQVLQVVAGSEVAVAGKAARLVLDQLPHTAADLVETLGDLLLWALAYRTSEGHTGMLLTLGRDLHRSRLHVPIDPKHPRARRLTATLPSAVLDTASVMQERVMRTIAAGAWHGELRTNPGSALLDKRVTVHSQGGCPMGTDSERAVTDPWGQVHGCPGLYVMDAAAFPTSVGVNPSAAITAIAEFKIEHFIRQHREPDWTATDKARATKWVDDKGRDALDPLNCGVMQDNDEKTCQPLGLIFCEVMHGFLIKIADHDRPVLDWDNPEAFPRDLSAFTSAEDEGVKQGTTIKVALTADVTDLARLISPDPSLAAAKVGMVEAHSSVSFGDLKATPTLTSAGTPKEPPALSTKGFLRLFVRPSRAPDKPIRFFRYQLDFADEKGTARQLNGLKLLRNAPGLDLWHETSTLYFEISDHGSQRNRQRGILRISAEDFLRVQVPSLFITGTNDDARKSWALAAFSKYYARELAVVYQTHKEHVMSLITKLMTAIHV